MIDDQDKESEPVEVENNDESAPDETMHLFVYGNLLIKDVDTGQILVNKSF